MIPAFDRQWRDRAVAGVPQAIEALADAVTDPLFRFCLYRVGSDWALAEDVVQDTLVQAIERLDEYIPERCDGQIMAWLCGLARNRIRSLMAQQKRDQSLDQLWDRLDQDLLAAFARLEDEELDTAILQRPETQELVRVTMSQLPEHYSQVLEGKYVQALSVEALAAHLGRSISATEALLKRARAAFRNSFVIIAQHLGKAVVKGDAR